MATSASNLNLNKIQNNPFASNGQNAGKVKAQNKETQAIKEGSVWNVANTQEAKSSNGNNKNNFLETGNMND